MAAPANKVIRRPWQRPDPFETFWMGFFTGVTATAWWLYTFLGK